MKTTTMIQTLSATAISLILSAGMATAHSDHDNSELAMQWKFSKKVEAKIQSRGALEGNGYYVGLSSHELNTLDHYGIRAGNVFTTMMDGVNAKVKRTSAGIQIVDTEVMDIGLKRQMPIRPVNWVSTVSTGHAHGDHQHGMAPYEWSFGESTQERIANRLDQGVVFVGLNHFEQTVLNNYEIKIGNQFHTVVNGKILLAKRTSGGLKVLGSATEEIAQADANQGRM